MRDLWEESTLDQIHQFQDPWVIPVRVVRAPGDQDGVDVL